MRSLISIVTCAVLAAATASAQNPPRDYLTYKQYLESARTWLYTSEAYVRNERESRPVGYPPEADWKGFHSPIHRSRLDQMDSLLRFLPIEWSQGRMSLESYEHALGGVLAAATALVVGQLEEIQAVTFDLERTAQNARFNPALQLLSDARNDGRTQSEIDQLAAQAADIERKYVEGHAERWAKFGARVREHRRNFFRDLARMDKLLREIAYGQKDGQIKGWYVEEYQKFQTSLRNSISHWDFRRAHGLTYYVESGLYKPSAIALTDVKLVHDPSRGTATFVFSIERFLEPADRLFASPPTAPSSAPAPSPPPVASNPAPTRRKPLLVGMPAPQILGVVAIDDGLFPKYTTPQERTVVSRRDRDVRRLLVYGIRLPTKRANIQLGGGTKLLQYKLLAAPEDWHHPDRWRAWKEFWSVGWAKAAPTLHDLPADVRALVNGMIVEARVGADQLAGIKRISVSGLQGDWILPTGVARADIRIVRLLPDRRYETSDVFYTPERLCVEVETSLPVELDEIPVVMGKNEAVIKFGQLDYLTARKVSANLYRTPPFITMFGDEPPAPMGNTRYAMFKSRVRLSAMVPATVGFARSAVNSAIIWASPDEAGIAWDLMLKRAATAAKVEAPADQDRLPLVEVEKFTSHSFSDYIADKFTAPARFIASLFSVNTPETLKFQATRTVTVTVGDLAAMILLRGTFRSGLAEHIRMVDVMASPEALDNTAKVIAEELPENHPICRTPAFRNGQRTGTTLRQALRPLYRRYEDGPVIELIFSPESTARIVREVVPGSLEQYKSQVSEASEKARALGDTDIKGLIRLTGFGFGPSQARLIPRLMRIDDPRGGRLAYWVPDERARGFVRGLEYLAQHVKANEDVAKADTQLMLMVAALVPISLPAHMVRTVIAAAVGVADVVDVVFTQIPDYFQRRAEVVFATQAAALLNPARVTQAEMDSPSALGTIIAAVGATIGLRFDAADLLRVSRAKPPIKEIGEMIAAKGHSQIIEAIWDFPPAQKQSFIAAAAEVTAKARSAGEAALSAPEREIWRVVQEMEGPAGRAVMAAKRAARDTILEFDGPVIPSMSARYKVVPDAKPELPNFKIVGAIGRGEYCTVWDYVDHLTGGVANKVLKMVRRASAEDFSTAEEVLQRMLDAQALLKGAKIPYKPILAHKMKPEPYFLQERIPANSSNFKILDPATMKPGEFTESLQIAVLELYQKLGKAGLVWTDGKLDNIYFELIGNKWVAGVLDTDFIVEFGKPISNAYNAKRLRTMEAWPGKYGIRSADADIEYEMAIRWTQPDALTDPTRLYPSAEFAMMKMLEWRGFVEVGYTTNAWSGRLIENLELVEEFFPGFRNATYQIPRRAHAPATNRRRTAMWGYQTWLAALCSTVGVPQVKLRPAN